MTQSRKMAVVMPISARTICETCSALLCVTLVLSSLVDCSPVERTRTVSSPDQQTQCLYQNKTYSGGHKFRPDPCTHCKCPKNGGEAQCAVQDCFAEPNCLKLKLRKHECCGTCLKYGCQHSDGKIYEPGTSVPTNNDCEVCYCPKDGGATICQHRMRCAPVSCVDPVHLPGDCCARCLDGDNCWLTVNGRKEILRAGETKILDDCRQCSCPTGYLAPYLRARGPEAFCTEADC